MSSAGGRFERHNGSDNGQVYGIGQAWLPSFDEILGTQGCVAPGNSGFLVTQDGQYIVGGTIAVSGGTELGQSYEGGVYVNGVLKATTSTPGFPSFNGIIALVNIFSAIPAFSGQVINIGVSPKLGSFTVMSDIEINQAPVASLTVYQYNK